MKLTTSTNKYSKNWLVNLFSLIGFAELTFLILLLSLIGAENGIAEENNPNVQEQLLHESGSFFESVTFFELKMNNGSEFRIEKGNSLLITPKEDKILELITDKTRIPGRFKIPLMINKLKDSEEDLHYLVVGFMMVDEGPQFIFNIGISSVGTPWPSDLYEKEDALSISRGYTGSGSVLIFVIDSSYIERTGVGKVTINGIMNEAEVLSNILKQQILFIDE